MKRIATAVAVIMSAGAVRAAEPPTADAADIVVTATKRPSAARDVPISITTLGASTLAGAGVTSSTDLGQVTPGLVISQNALFSQPTLRGVGTLSTAAGDEPNVTTYVDGVYQSQMFGNLYEFNNIERIEVLKGPQGTLFGRNATGGAISIVTRSPDPDGPATLLANASYGRFDEIKSSAYAALGLGDGLAADLALLYSRDDGYVRDLVRSGRLADSNVFGARSKLRLKRGSLDLTLAADYQDGEDRSGVSSQPLNGNTLARALVPTVFLPTDIRSASLDVDPRNRVTQYGTSLTADLDLGRAKLVSISSYRHSRLLGVVDTDATAVPVFSLRADQYSRTATEELQLQSVGGPIDWLAGFYLYDDHSGYDPLALSNGARIVAEVRTRAYAGFGESTVPLGPSLRLTGGLRYSRETKTLTGSANGSAIQPAEATFDDFSPRVSLLWRVDPKLNLFATASRGFKSGVFNSSSLSRTPVRPERLDAVEIGAKGAAGPFRADLSAFRYWYSDIQVQVYDAATSVSRLENAATARMWGVDLDTTAKATRDVEFRFGLDYLHARYGDFRNATVTVPTGRGGNLQLSSDASGNDVIRAPDLTVSLGLDAAQPLKRGELYLAGNLYHNGGFAWDVGNRVRQPAYEVLNLEAGWRIDRAGRTKIALWGRNLTDAVYAVTSQQSTLADSVNYARPRTFGIKAPIPSEVEMTENTTTSDHYGTIRVERPATAVARIVLDRPRQRNAQDLAMTYELRDAFDAANADDDVKVIILAGSDPHFSSGHDLQSDGPVPLDGYRHSGTWAGFGQSGAEGLYAREREIYLDMCERIRSIGKPTIAQVQGRCAAGGLMLAWVCDIILASDDATFVDPVVALGVAGVEYFAHPFELGIRKAKELLFTADAFDAAEAHRLGMVNHVVARAGLPEFALAMAERIAAKPSFALKMTKEAVNAAEDAMGRRQAMLTAFAIHQLCHAHNRQEFGAIIDPRGLPEGVRRQFAERLRHELDPAAYATVAAKLGLA